MTTHLGDTPYNGLYRGPTRKEHIFQPKLYNSVGITPAEVYEMVEKPVSLVSVKDLTGQPHAFGGSKLYFIIVFEKNNNKRKLADLFKFKRACIFSS